MLAEGKTVIIPTETVYGLAANALDPVAVAQIFIAKGRPQDNPLIVHLASGAEMHTIARVVPDTAKKLADAYWPGPLTMILPKKDNIPTQTSGGLDTVAIRVPASGVARAIIEQAGVPLAAPSANRSGSPSPTTYQHCIDDMMGRVDGIVQGDNSSVGVESTVITLCTNPPTLLRPGAVTIDQLRETLGEVAIDKGVLEQLAQDTKVSSPGMKYKHYAPKANVVLIKGKAEDYCNYVNQNKEENHCAVCFTEDTPLIKIPYLCYGDRADHTTQAREIFDILRSLDKRGITNAYIHAPEMDGIGLAVYNRLIRSAGFDVIQLPI